MWKNLVWFGEIERKLAKLSMTTFTYFHPLTYLMFLIELISSSTDSFLLGGESADWGLCAGSEPAPEAAGSRAGGRAAEAGGENRFHGPGGRVGKKPFFLTSPVDFLGLFLYICPEQRVFRVFLVSRILLGTSRL
jgi:hypothetical protein